MSLLHAAPARPCDGLRPVAARERDQTGNFINVAGFGVKLAEIVASENFPADQYSIDGIVRYLENNRPDLLSDVSADDEKRVKVALGIITPYGPAVYRFQYVIEKRRSAKKLSVDTLNNLVRESNSVVSALENLIVPPRWMTARFIAEPFGDGYDNIRQNRVAGGRAPVISATAHFNQCINPKSRKFVGQWHRDYAEMLTHMSAKELEDEWTRLGGSNRLYVSTVYEFMHDTLHLCYPGSVITALERDFLAQYIAVDNLERRVIYIIAREAIHLEWASRHWSSKISLKSARSLRRKITPNLEYFKKTMPPLYRDDGSIVTFGRRPVCKILRKMTHRKAFRILGIPPPVPDMPRTSPEEITLTQI